MHCTYLSGGAAVVTEWKHATAYYSTYTYPAAAPPPTTTILTVPGPTDSFSDTMTTMATNEVDLYKNKCRADKNHAILSIPHHLISASSNSSVGGGGAAAAVVLSAAL